MRPPLPCASASPSVRLFAEQRLRRVPEVVGRALVAWSEGRRPVDLLFHVPSPRDVLALQARGRRCVSLLDERTSAHPHEDGLAFVIHDLCHLEKFVDPEHHAAQVGFFAQVKRAMEDPRWDALEAPLDEAWAADRDHVIADMNGSAVFLLLALKSKLRMAIRRGLALARGDAPHFDGPPSDAEQRACDDALDLLLTLLAMQGPAADAAHALATRGGSPDAEARLHRHLHSLGEAVLAGTAPPLSVAVRCS